MSNSKYDYLDYVSRLNEKPYEAKAIELAKLYDTEVETLVTGAVLKKYYKVISYGIDIVTIKWEVSWAYGGYDNGHIEFPSYWLWFDGIEEYLELTNNIKATHEKLKSVKSDYTLRSNNLESQKHQFKDEVVIERQQEIDTLKKTIDTYISELESMKQQKTKLEVLNGIVLEDDVD